MLAEDNLVRKNVGRTRTGICSVQAMTDCCRQINVLPMSGFCRVDASGPQIAAEAGSVETLPPAVQQPPAQ